MVSGTSLILKNLSVRLVTVLLHVGTVFTIWQTVKTESLEFRDESLEKSNEETIYK